MKKVLRGGLKYLIVYLILIVIFLTSLTLVSLIPSKNMYDNTKVSAEILKEQTNRWTIRIRLIPIVFDNYTDALMVNTAYSIDNKAPLKSFMMAKKNYLPGKTRVIIEDQAGELLSAGKYKELDQVGDLNDTINGNTEEAFEYARYWHGYLVWLRPLLCLANISVIRIILIVIFDILGILLVGIIAKKVKVVYGILIRYADFYVLDMTI